MFVESLYESVVTCCPMAMGGHILAAQAVEVGTVEEEVDQLVGAEANPRCGPAYDLQLLRKLTVAHDVPSVLPFLCINAQEMRKQCHQGCIPLVLIRYKASKKAMDTLRYTSYKSLQYNFIIISAKNYPVVMLCISFH
ncbi:uncharacterized protein LOC111335896 [Stylophora pistillata]|uniref:uncharacterized protein LOC111335896 n=1 Tax=Stylophora pistillata TaxID=50429 RepID=UPI000C0504CB|nr:uncharacterized protein LOC111335896 [Stylophora pistillata]